MTRAKAKQLRQLIEQLAVTLADETALTGVELFPMWAIGRAYAVDDRVQHGGTLYKCVQAHTSQADWAPDKTPALWAVVSKGQTGTVDDPIPFTQPMQIYKDKYYSQNGKVYLCTRDSGQPLAFNLAELVGLYVTEVS